jgi:hypothetical protein
MEMDVSVLKTCEVSKRPFNPSQSFANLFNAYTTADATSFENL